MNISIIISGLGLIVAGLGYWETRRSNSIQERQAIAFEEANAIALRAAGQEIPMATPESVVFRRSYASVVALAILLLMNFAVTGFSVWRQSGLRFDKAAWAKFGSQLESHVGENYANTVVPLDGRNYSACTFENVTFQYRGTSPFQLVNNIFRGQIRLEVENDPPMIAGVGALLALGFVRPEKIKDVNSEMMKWTSDATQPLSVF
jgi:hypothetical protein